LFAAFDATSSSISIALHLLSQNSDWQDKLRAEVTEALQNGDVPFEELNSLPYLDAVCRETLRL
jgi:cytochrome P450